MTAGPAAGSRRGGRGERGQSLVEMLAALGVFGLILLAIAPLTAYFLRSASVERLQPDGYVLGFGVLPMLREDARATRVALRNQLGLSGGARGLVLDLGEGHRPRAVVYRSRPGRVIRSEYVEDADGDLHRSGVKTWRGGFIAELGVEEVGGRTFVGLEAELPGGPLSFRFCLRQ